MIFPIHHLPDVIRVGVQTDQDVDVIGFDIKPWMDIFPDMTFTVFATRPGEDEAYPVNDQLMVGTVLYWHPDGYDTEIAGQGRVEIAGVGENQRKASGFALTDIRATSLGKTKEPGESVAPWYESILKAAEEIKDAHGDGGLFLVREVNHVADRTVAEIVEAADAGKTVLLVKTGGKVYMLNNVILDKPTFYAVQSGTLQNPQGFGIVVSEAWIDTDGTVKGGTPNVSKTPNPYPIKLTGAVNATYDGSSAVTVEIPQGSAKTVQPDWTQNNAAAPAYVQNRTHYDVKGQSWPDGAAVEEGAPSAEIHKADGTLGAFRWVKVGHAPEAESLVGHCKLSSVGMVTEENILDRSESGYLLGREYEATSTTGVTRTLRSVSAVVCLKAGYAANGWPLTEPLDNLSTATIPEPGLYLPVRSDGTVYRGYELQPYTKPLEDRFIPSTVTRNSEVQPLVSSERINGLIDGKLSIFGQAVCLPETTHDNGSNLVLNDPWAVEIRAGQDYIVIYNGKTYRLTARNIPDSAVGAVLLGNGTNADLPDHNPDLPFGVLALSNAIGAQIGVYGTVYTYDNVKSFTVAIYEASRKGYYYYDGDTARLVGIKELRQALIDAGNPVIILPETTVQGEDGQMFLTTALTADPEAGVTYKVTYNRTAYDCHALAYATDDMSGVMLGNSDALGLVGGNPDAPFVALLMPGGTDGNDGTIYGLVMDMTGANSATISILEEASGPEYMTREQVVKLIEEMTGNNA